MTTLIYSGTFDPITKGHQHLIERASQHFSDIIIAVAVNSSKKTLFSADQRCALIQILFPQITVKNFQGLLIDFARQYSTPLILRGIRTLTDFDYETQMALLNQKLLPTLDTFFMMPYGDYGMISASRVREIAMLGGDVSSLVDPIVVKALQNKYSRMSS